MQVSIVTSCMRIIRGCILIPAACTILQVTAADENASATSIETGPPNPSLDQSEPASGRAAGNSEETMEEITVIGQKQIFDLRKQIIQAEDHVFGLFNELNDDDEYDIYCRMEAPIGSNIKRRMCLPNFYLRVAKDNASELLGLIGDYSNYSGPSPSIRNVFARQNPILQKKVRELAKQSPELLDALRMNYELNEELKKQRNAYHGVGDK